MPAMSWSGSILGGLAGCVGLSCAPGPQVAAPSPMLPARPAGVVAAAEPVVDAGESLRARLCGARAPCGLRRTRAAGVDAEGRALAVVSVELGAGGAADGSFTEEAWVDQFTAAAQGQCRSVEYWLVVGEPQAPVMQVPLLQVCNEGNGAAGLGEDTVTIAEDSLEHASFGGSNWRWSRTQRLELAPLRVREVSFDGSFALGPNRQEGGWSFDRFAGATAWYSPPCDRAGDRPLEVEEALQVEFSYSAIPAVAMDAAFVAGWKQTGLGACALTLGTDTDARVRVVAAGATALYVEIEDDQVTRGDRLELWLADEAASYMDHCLADEPAGLRAWEIDVRDGRVVAGHGRPAVAGLTVERGEGLRLRLAPREGFAAVSVVYVDRDDGEAQARRLATSALVPGRRETLGRLETIDAAAASCAVVAGRLEPVLHAYAGAGPVLR